MPSATYPHFWHQHGALSRLLLPLSLLYRAAAWRRRRWYAAHPDAVQWLAAPVLVVGNLSVGGTGKTPLVIWLVEEARRRGLRPGVILRGHGARQSGPTAVADGADPIDVGDEAVLLARRTGAPVVIGRDRAAAGQHLLERFDADLLISDDGLQHLRLGRDVEIAVVDAGRGLGNRRCLPAGPLREPADGLARMDGVIANGAPWPGADGWFALRAGEPMPVGMRSANNTPPAPGEWVHAVAGIGNPERFFATLRRLGFEVEPHPFPDHHVYRPEELRFAPAAPVVMTEKDAVKCAGFALPGVWQLPVRAEPSPDTANRLGGLLELACRRAKER